MKIDAVYILAAGQGSRMGKIGKSLPKPMWPLFERTLLECKILHAREIFKVPIYVNFFHQKRLLSEFVAQKNLDVEIINEGELMGSGGSVTHFFNIAPKSINNIYVTNSDQFQFLDYRELEVAYELFSTQGCCLLGTHVSSSHYNETIIEDQRLTEIGPGRNGDFVTFSGNYFLSRKRTPEFQGPCSLFGPVLDYKRHPQSIPFHIPNEEEYWDFGTKELYFENIMRSFKALADSGQASELGMFFERSRSFDRKKVNAELGSYSASQRNVFNFSRQKISQAHDRGLIVLGAKHEVQTTQAQLYFDGLEDVVDKG